LEFRNRELFNVTLCVALFIVLAFTVIHNIAIAMQLSKCMAGLHKNLPRFGYSVLGAKMKPLSIVILTNNTCAPSCFLDLFMLI
jgi:hypothetical protein